MIKRIHRTITKGANWILAGILSILGFSGCEINNGVEEYGTPYATFSFHGKVANNAKKPVKGIKVEVCEGQGGYPVTDSVLTNETGQYSIQFQTFPNENFRVIVSDIDGEANGSYQNDTIRVKISDKDYYEKGNGSWNYGLASKEVDVVLKEKE
jgi:putative lipoprotein (rSAM/lipoprotein system)